MYVCGQGYINKEGIVKKYYDLRPSDGLKPSARKNIKLRNQIDGRKCQICGRDDVRLHTHHIDGKSYQKYGDAANNSFTNLITVCPHCHMRLHNPRPELNEIIQRHLNGETYQEIATSFGLTRQRIHQLIKHNSEANS